MDRVINVNRAKLANIALEFIFTLWKATPVLFLLISSSCMPGSLPDASPGSVIAQPTTPPEKLSTTPNTEIPASKSVASPEAVIVQTATSVFTPTVKVTSTAPVHNLSEKGPWLAYHDGINLSCFETTYDEIMLLNLDSMGKTKIKVPKCDLEHNLLIEENPDNRIAILGKTYLIQPSQSSGRLIYQQSPTLHTTYAGDSQAGTLASIYGGATDTVPELRIFELPSGKIKVQIPLVESPDHVQDCIIYEDDWWGLQWSPDGKILAFQAILDGPVVDLYIYDIETGMIQRLTNGPDHVGQIWWSADGSRIIFGKNTSCNNLDTNSLWIVALDEYQILQLYSLEYPFPQELLGWLDNERFLAYDGSLTRIVEEGAFNLRLVDVGAPESQVLFGDGFVDAALDVAHETVALNVIAYNRQYEDGVYLVSSSDPAPIRVSGYESDGLTWNEDLGIFVTNAACEQGGAGVKAFNYQGEWSCVQHPSMLEDYPSPNGQWRVTFQDGVWLTHDSQPAAQISPEPATQVIWCPDSGCFLFVAEQSLYHVSLPDQVVRIADDQLEADTIVFQWLH